MLKELQGQDFLKLSLQWVNYLIAINLIQATFMKLASMCLWILLALKVGYEC